MLEGPDVSEYQGTIDWLTLASRSAFCYVRASHGLRSDARFADNWAASCGLVPRGAYLYLEADYPLVDQAYYFLDRLVPDLGELPAAIDVEDERNRGGWINPRWQPLDPDALAAVSAILELELKRKPLIYTRRSYWDAREFWNLSRFWDPARYPRPEFKWREGNPLWVASYNQVAPALPSDWDTWTFWQLGQVPGAPYGVQSPTIDLNRFNGSLEDLKRLCSPTMSNSATTPTAG